MAPPRFKDCSGRKCYRWRHHKTFDLCLNVGKGLGRKRDFGPLQKGRPLPLLLLRERGGKGRRGLLRQFGLTAGEGRSNSLGQRGAVELERAGDRPEIVEVLEPRIDHA